MQFLEARFESLRHPFEGRMTTEDPSMTSTSITNISHLIYNYLNRNATNADFISTIRINITTKKFKKYTSNIYNIRVSKKSYKTLHFTNFIHIQFSFHPIYITFTFKFDTYSFTFKWKNITISWTIPHFNYNYFEQEMLQNIYKYKTILIFTLH